MIDSSSMVSSSLEALTKRYEMLTHNLSNTNTVAFKRICGNFEQSASGCSAGVQDKPKIDFSQGLMAQTNRPLDVAISGKGFFVLETPSGVLYTRNGTFATNSTGQLVDASGRTIAGENGPITIPASVSPTTIQIGPDGKVTAGSIQLGKLKIVDFEKPGQLISVGASTFKAPRTADPQPATKARLRQGYQESSNVNIVRELVSLMTVTRMYEANLKTVNSGDDRYKTLLQVALG